MPQIAILERKCVGCGTCADRCPFGGVAVENNRAVLNAACRQCGLCEHACSNGAILRMEARKANIDKSAWHGILVVGEIGASPVQPEDAGTHRSSAFVPRLHPVSMELVGKALELAAGSEHPVRAALAGFEVAAAANELLHYAVEEIFLYQSAQLRGFRSEAYVACFVDAIEALKPSVVLVGATAWGRSLAPRLATRLRTGLTADCTILEMRGDELIQTRPAFGGNIMARILTPDSRPQFATVRPRVMDAPPRSPRASGAVVEREMPAFTTGVRVLDISLVPPAADIQAAETLVIAGRGLRRQTDLDMVRELAALLGGDWAVSRPLVEMGWAEPSRQVGLSGRTVKPRLCVTCGVSGAVQFAASMNQSAAIVSINHDRDAPIFEVAHLGLLGDLYEVVPEMLAALRS